MRNQPYRLLLLLHWSNARCAIRESDGPRLWQEVIVRKWNNFAGLAGAVVLVGMLSACSVTSGQESGGQYVDDATITTKVKASLAADVGLSPAGQIHVTTSKQVVQLSGFVNSDAHKAEAESVARGVEGVKDVQNDIIIQQ